MKVYKCGQCGHENDLTRVFCQNCGSRLEREEVEGSGTAEPAAAETGPYIARNFTPLKTQPLRHEPGVLSRLVRSLVSLIVISAILAALVQILRAPDGIPAPRPANEPQAAQLLSLVKTFASSGAARTLDIPEAQANNFLQCQVVPADSSEKALWKAQFKRAFVVYGENQFRLAVEQEVLGRPVFMYLDYIPASSAQGTSANVIGGGLGRLPVHPGLLPFFQGYFSTVIDALGDVLGTLSKASSVQITPDAARLSWGGQRPRDPAP